MQPMSKRAQSIDQSASSVSGANKRAACDKYAGLEKRKKKNMRKAVVAFSYSLKAFGEVTDVLFVSLFALGGLGGLTQIL